MSINLSEFIVKNPEICQKFKGKNIFIVNHSSFYGKLFEKFFSLLGNELVCGSRENGFDILNKRDVDFWSYKEADIIIYPGIDFSQDFTDCKIVTAVNLVVGLANLLQYKKDSALFYYFNSNRSDILNFAALNPAIELSEELCKLKNNCVVAAPWGLSICKENAEIAFERMIKEIASQI